MMENDFSYRIGWNAVQPARKVYTIHEDVIVESTVHK